MAEVGAHLQATPTSSAQLTASLIWASDAISTEHNDKACLVNRHAGDARHEASSTGTHEDRRISAVQSRASRSTCEGRLVKGQLVDNNERLTPRVVASDM
jgi:hypothetical protein